MIQHISVQPAACNAVTVVVRNVVSLYCKHAFGDPMREDAPAVRIIAAILHGYAVLLIVYFFFKTIRTV